MEGGPVRGALAPNAWVHFTAIGGTGMGALAALLQDLGYFVTGSDGPLYPPMSDFLAERRIPLQNGYAAAHLDSAHWKLPALAGKTVPDLVIVGNAISRANAEAQKVEELLAAGKTQRLSHAQALAEFGIADRRSFVVSGTHGKTTTTTILAWALQSLGREPGFFIGGIPKNFGFGCRIGGPSSSARPGAFASEGDEYDTAYWDKESKFLHYRPSWVLCTGIEYDHADIFADVQAIEKMFVKLGGKTREGWLLVDDVSAPRPESTRAVAESLARVKTPDGSPLRVLRYGKDPKSDYVLLASEARRLPWRPDVMGTAIGLRTPELGTIELVSPMSGEHNALNLAGVVGTLLAAGETKSLADMQEFLRGFQGVKRRQDEVVVAKNLVVIDDFAHHPTAIRETIRAMKSRYPDALLAAFFEARSATSARNVFAKDFAECFDDADAIFLSPPSKTNIPDGQKLDVPALVADIRGRAANAGKEVCLEKEIPALAQGFARWQSQRAERPVVALVMSNGPFGGIHQLLAAGHR